MKLLQDSFTLGFASIVAATFIVWVGSAYPRLKRPAQVTLGVGATVFACLSFYDFLSVNAAAWWSLLTSIALANQGFVLRRIPDCRAPVLSGRE